MSEIYPMGQSPTDYNPYVGQVASEGFKEAHSKEPQQQFEVFKNESTKNTSIDIAILGSQTETLNEVVKLFNHQLKFEVDDRSDEIVVKIIDTDSGEVVRQIPPEEILNMRARIDEVIGMMVDEKA